MRNDVFAALGLLASVACAPPQRDVAAADVPNLRSLDDVMDVQATTADPQMKKAGQSTYTDADFAAFAETANRLQATSLKAKQWSKGPGYDELADRLHDAAGQLGQAAAAKDAQASSDSLATIHATCKECHSKFD